MPGLESTLAAAEVGMIGSLDYRLPSVSNFDKIKDCEFKEICIFSYANVCKIVTQLNEFD